jgi:hypothetical protein
MGEEYVRRIMVLGSVPSLGPVILFDDMEKLLKFTAVGTGADFVCEKSQVQVYNEDYSLHVATRATDPADGDYVSVVRSIMSRPGKRYRGECLFWSSLGAAVASIDFWFGILDGAEYHEVKIRWDQEAERWFYYSSAGAWAELPLASSYPSASNWHRLMLEWNQISGKYIKMVCDAMEVDMSELSYRKTASVGSLSMHAYFRVEAAGAAQAHAYFDDLLVLEI